jgi:hypothetical protein
LRATNSKTRKGTSPAGQDAQFDDSNARIEAFQSAGQQTISAPMHLSDEKCALVSPL